MNHSHIYGILNNVCYRVPVIKEHGCIVKPNEFVSTVQPKLYPDAKIYTLHVNINTAEYKESITNFDYCKKIIEWVTANKASVINDLRDTFKIEVDYSLYGSQDELIDEGTAVRTVEPAEAFILMATTETNEMQYKKAVKFSQVVKFNKLFPASYGMLGSLSSRYTFSINAIRLKGSIDAGAIDRTPVYTSNKIIDVSGREHMGTTTSTKDAITLYDTSAVGIEFPINIIPFKPAELGISIDLLLDEFCEFGDETTLLNALVDAGGNISSNPGTLYPCHPNIHPHPGFPPCGNGPIYPLKPNNPDKPDDDKKDDDKKDDDKKDDDKPDPTPTPDPDDDEPEVDPSMVWELQPADGYETENDIVYTIANGLDTIALDTIAKYLPEATVGSKVYFKRTTDGWKPFLDTGNTYTSIFIVTVSDADVINIETAKKHMSDPHVGDKVYWGWTYNI